ncbi:ABC transporter ATP-binding protein [Nocardioides humi]|uniref:ABC transporter ATP-binding protein n=1 Tax=Nocardioides humi TaxID=449461 RepID=A0ABN2AEU6_9ACTN|nr:ABC transporter ATP-binding protein [Nocardioides humi]
MSTVAIDGLEKRFGEFTAIRQLDLTVEQGELVSLLGPSGCGKTTTLRCVAGLEHPTAGTISIGARLVAHGGRGRTVPPEKRDLGMVFQSYALWPHMTVAGNVAYPLRRAGVRRSEARRRAAEMVELVGLAAKLDSPVSQLSGGQQQRVSLARALVKSPQVLLCDEPLSNLDASLRRQVRNEIRRLHDETGTTCVYVTHDQEEAVALSDRIVVMQDGEATQIGSPRDIFSRPRTEFIARFVGIENVLPVADTAIRAGGGHELGTALGSRLVSAQTLDESPVACAFRSEDVVIADDVAELNVFRATVLNSTFVGTYTELLLQVDGTTVGCRLPERDLQGRARPEVGGQVAFRVAPENVVPLASA